MVADKFSQGARKAWQTRRKQGWKRKTLNDKAQELLVIAKKLKKKRFVKALQHRYRSKARRRQVIQAIEDELVG